MVFYKIFFLVSLFSFSFCSHHEKITGGQRPYLYDVNNHYNLNDLKQLSPLIVQTKMRNPREGQIKDLFSRDQDDLRRIGFLVFETSLQPTPSGLAKDDLFYLSKNGQTKLTQQFLKIWEESFSLLGRGEVFLMTFKEMSNGIPKNYPVKALTEELNDSDIFYLKKGKKVSSLLTTRPSESDDLSLFLVRAYDFLGGPKSSSYRKHEINELAKKYSLDALILVYSQVNWKAKTSSQKRKNSSSSHDQLFLEIDSSILIPFSSYLKRLKNISTQKDLQRNVCFRNYHSKISFPLYFSEGEKNLAHIHHQILAPLLKSYTEVSQMMIIRMIDDLKSTFKK